MCEFAERTWIGFVFSKVLVAGNTGASTVTPYLDRLAVFWRVRSLCLGDGRYGRVPADASRLAVSDKLRDSRQAGQNRQCRFEGWCVYGHVALKNRRKRAHFAVLNKHFEVRVGVEERDPCLRR